MAQNTHQRRASQRVAAWLAQNERNNAWLVERTKADPGTIGDFLNGHRWPKRGTQGKIEKALGWPAGSIHQMGQGDEVDVPMTASVGPSPDPEAYVSAPGPRVESGITNEDLMREILRSRAEYDQLRAEVREQGEGIRQVRERLDRLEQGPERS